MRRDGSVIGRSAVVAVVASLALVGCSGDDEPADSTEPTASADVPSTEPPLDSTDTGTSELPSDVTPAGVILAATLIATGNIDDAVASGLVTPAEVDEAQKSIEDGTLDRWVALAEGE